MGGTQSLAAPSVPLTAEVYPQCAPHRTMSQSDGEKQYVVWPCKSASHARAAATHTSKEPENASKPSWLTLLTNHALQSQTCGIELRPWGVYIYSTGMGAGTTVSTL